MLVDSWRKLSKYDSNFAFSLFIFSRYFDIITKKLHFQMFSTIIIIIIIKLGPLAISSIEFNWIENREGCDATAKLNFLDNEIGK